MSNYTADYYALVPVWGTVSLEAADKDQFLFDAEAYIRDTEDGATNIEIKNIEVV